METGRSLWPLIWEGVVALPALLLAVVVVVGALRLQGLARGLAIAAGLALGVYELQGLVRMGSGLVTELPPEVFFGWALLATSLYLVTVLLFVGAAVVPRSTS